MRAKQVLMLLITGIIFFSCNSLKDNYLPDSINEFKLIKKIEGDEARAYINRLHLKQVAPQKNVIAVYKNNDQEMALYLTYYPQEAQAREDWQRMVAKISPENSVFIKGEVIEKEGRQVYRCFGMGQTHFVFVNKNVLVWLSTPTIGSSELFKAYNQLLD